MKDKCPRCRSELRTKYDGITYWLCESQLERPENVFIQSELCKTNAELTKLKADVVRLRGALGPFVQESVMNYYLRASEFNAETINAILTVKLSEMRSAARALEETKP